MWVVKLVFLFCLALWTAMAIGQLAGSNWFLLTLIVLFPALIGLTFRAHFWFGSACSVVLGGALMWAGDFSPVSALSPFAFYCAARALWPYPPESSNYSAEAPPDPNVAYRDSRR